MDKIWVPQNLTQKILELHHSSRTAVHPGIGKTQIAISKYWYWPTLKKDTCEYVTACDICQCIKPHQGWRPAPLHPLPIPTQPWQVISWDLIGPLLDSAGYNMILVIKDYFTQSVIIRPTQQELTAQGTATILLEHVYANYGLLEKVVSNHGGQFMSKFMQEVYQVLRIQTAASTAYHPQTNGHTE